MKMSLLNLEKEYKGLLAPIKSAEQSFEIPVADSIHDFLLKFCQENLNFNSAAIILQAGTSVYGKKVECLYNLFHKFLDQLSSKKKKGDSQEKEKKTPKEREKKEKNQELFLSTEIKSGKNLSCLAKKSSLKSSRKKEQKPEKTFTLAPAYLLKTEDEQNKGEVFYDVKGAVVGYKGDFVLTRCRLTSSGWLLLPVTSLDFIPINEADYTMEETNEANENACNSYQEINQSPNSQDEGIGSAPMSMGTNSVGCTPNADPQAEVVGAEMDVDPVSEDIPCTDEGIGIDDMGDSPNMDNGSQPLGDDVPGVEEIENIPVNNLEGSEDPAPNPIRRSVRKALNECQLDEQNAQKPEVLLRRAIQKKNTICLPLKLKQGDSNNEATVPLSAFCSKAFYEIEDKVGNSNSKILLELYCLKQNACVNEEFEKHLEYYKTAVGRKKLSDTLLDETQGNLRTGDDDDNEEDAVACPTFEDCDIEINNNPDISADENPIAEDMGMCSDDDIVDKQEPWNNYQKSAADYEIKCDLTAKIQAWEEKITPFLDEQDYKPAFDINSYGSYILNSFEDTVRKQTKTFKDICKGKPKWQVHRYFMALLPLANIGNVSLEADPHPDGTEDILVTLLSRKMHHKELEKFGHNEGSHD